MHTAIPPFWERLPSIALYPFRRSALSTLIVLGTLMGVASFIPLIGWLIVLVLWLSVFKQTFEMLLATTNCQRRSKSDPRRSVSGQRQQPASSA